MKKRHILFALFIMVVLSGCCQHEWGGGSCISPVVCKNCGRSGKDMGKHSWSTKVLEEPTCFEEGKSETYCANCGLISFTSSIKTLPHNYEKSKVILEPSCSEEGVDLYKCTICDAEKEEKIPSFVHDYGVSYVVREASCIEPGLVGRKCNRCSEVVIDRETPALGHKLGRRITTRRTTCTVAGLTERHCTRCDYVLTEEAIILGHNFVNAVVTKRADCESTGIKRYRCSFCGEYKLEELPALGHRFSEFIEETKPTCIEPGLKVRYCTQCGKKEELLVPELGHRIINNICYTCSFRELPAIAFTEDDAEEISLVDSISDVKAVYNGERLTFSYILRDDSFIGRRAPAILTLFIYDNDGSALYKGVHEITVADSRVRWTPDGSYQYNAIKIFEDISLQPRGIITEFGRAEYLIEISLIETPFSGEVKIVRY